MSMHPVESGFFFAEMMWHLLLPSAPFVALFQLTSTAYGAIVGHIGFDKLEMGETMATDSHGYTHYLHHKYFEVNYGGDGSSRSISGSAPGTTAPKRPTSRRRNGFAARKRG